MIENSKDRKRYAVKEEGREGGRKEKRRKTNSLILAEVSGSGFLSVVSWLGHNIYFCY